MRTHLAHVDRTDIMLKNKTAIESVEHFFKVLLIHMFL